MSRAPIVLLIAFAAAAACLPPSASAPKPEPAPVLAALAASAPAWWLDPANSTGCASDGNTCTTATCGAPGSALGPCLTWGQLEARWQCYSGQPRCPVLRQTTIVTWLSGQTTPSDAVRVLPALELGATFAMTSRPTVVQAGTLAGVVPRSSNRATSQLWQVTLAAGAAQGEYLVDNTSGATAMLYANPSGNNWTLEPPFTGASTQVPGTLNNPVVTNGPVLGTMANGDSYTLYALPQVKLVEWAPEIVDWGSLQNTVYPTLDRINVWDANFGNLDAGWPFNGVRVAGVSSIWQHSTVQRSANLQNTMTAGAVLNSIDVDWQAGPNAGGPELSGPISISFFGGAMRNSAAGLSHAAFRDDTIIGVPSFFTGGGYFGTVYIDSGQSLNLNGAGTWSPLQQNDGAFAIWGPGGLSITGTTRFAYGSSSFASFFLQTGGMLMNHGGAMCKCGGTTSPTSCGTAITPANLDTLGGGCVVGGASIVTAQ